MIETDYSGSFSNSYLSPRQNTSPSALRLFTPSTNQNRLFVDKLEEEYFKNDPDTKFIQDFENKYKEATDLWGKEDDSRKSGTTFFDFFKEFLKSDNEGFKWDSVSDNVYTYDPSKITDEDLGSIVTTSDPRKYDPTIRSEIERRLKQYDELFKTAPSM